ncbi:MAG: dihydrofolate reductase family protein [Desulfobaccales bacterium]
MSPSPEILRQGEARLTSAWGEWRVLSFADREQRRRHLALLRGDLRLDGEPLLAVHRRCPAGEILRASGCRCGERLEAALAALAQAEAGVILYLDLSGSSNAAAWECPLSHPDPRVMEEAACLLRQLGITSVRLLTEPGDAAVLSLPGIIITGNVPLLQEALPFPGDAALKARLGDLPEAARRFRQSQGRPLVTLTYAQSLDGSIAARPGHPLAISGPASQTFTHALRAVHDAILVGIGTVLADNPALTVRLVPGPHPRPVIMDTRLRLPAYARLLREGRRQPVVATSEQAPPERQAELEHLGALVLRLPVGPNGGIHLPVLLTQLAELGITALMVEGGAQVITSFLNSRLVDQVVVTVAPILVGGVRVLDGYLPVAERQFPRLAGVTYYQVGEDLVLWGAPRWS